MAETEHVKVEAFVEPGTTVVLIEAPILRRLQAENRVLREIIDYDEEMIWYEWGGKSGSVDYPGFKESTDFEARVRAVLSGE